jgi:CRP-like cAMP-binding protein
VRGTRSSTEPAATTPQRNIESRTDAIHQRFVCLGERIRLFAGATLVDVENPIPYAYVLTSGIASLLALTAAGHTVEMAMIGAEAVLVPDMLPAHETVAVTVAMIVAGTAIRIPCDRFTREIVRDDALRRAAQQSRDMLVGCVEQAVVCHSFHTVAGRFSTWLLRAGDHLASDTVPLTQALLARVLGTPRTTVTAVAVQLQDAHAIWYRRGTIVLTDRARLLQSACACYTDAHVAVSRPRSDVDSVDRPTLS